MSVGYSELRPVFTGETVTLTITVDGSGSIAGQTFSGALYSPTGGEILDAVAVVIADAAARRLTATINPMALPGDHKLIVRRTDGANNHVVFQGVVEVTDAARP
jgi:hypothetical protein